jgi:serine protease
MKRKVLLFSLALITILVVSTFAPVTATNSPDSGKTRVMVQYEKGSKSLVEKALKSNGAEFHYSFDEIDAFSVTVSNSALAIIRKNSKIAVVENDPVRYQIEDIPGGAVAPESPTYDPPQFPQEVPYGIDMVEARDVWDFNRDGVIDPGAPTGSNRLICIIDTGMSWSHLDLQAVNVVGGYPSGWWDDGHGHGTHVAGTIAAVNNGIGVVGVTPGTVNLYIVRVFGDSGEWIYGSDLINAAKRCQGAGANIISMSLGGADPSKTEQRGFEFLFKYYNVLSIAAAGNTGLWEYHYPASYPYVVSVGAIDSSYNLASFSTVNDDVELVAPGVDVLSTVPYYDYDLIEYKGNSWWGTYVDGGARGEVTGVLVDGGLCGSSGAWTGKVVLCQRGTYSFYAKALNVLNGGGVAAVIFNNRAGVPFFTLGTTLSLPVIALTQADGLALQTLIDGVSNATVSSIFYFPSSWYEYWSGTSMATPHVSGVAALIWSAAPMAPPSAIVAAMDATALDLGDTGRDDYFGYGLVQAYDAWGWLTNHQTYFMHIQNMDSYSFWSTPIFWVGQASIYVEDVYGNPVSGAQVSGAFSASRYSYPASCTTDGSGWCTVSSPRIRGNIPGLTFTVTGMWHPMLTYDPTENVTDHIHVSRP